MNLEKYPSKQIIENCCEFFTKVNKPLEKIQNEESDHM